MEDNFKNNVGNNENTDETKNDSAFFADSENNVSETEFAQQQPDSFSGASEEKELSEDSRYYDYDDDDDENNKNDDSKTKETSVLKEAFEWIQAIVVAVVVAMFLRTFVFTLVNVEGSSMVPTLHNNDKLIVWRLGYTPKIDDVIIFRPHGTESEPYVKRVIALEGQKVNIVATGNGMCDVYVDDVKLEEDYINEKITVAMMGDHSYPVTVPQGHIFVMGDNRNHSLDSRRNSVGMVDTDSIIGHAVCRVWPAGALGKID